MALCSSSTSTFSPAPRTTTSCPVYELDLNPRPVSTSHHTTVSKPVISGLSVLLANSKHCCSSTGDSFELASGLTTFVRGSYTDGVENYADLISSSPNSMKTRELSPVSVLQGPLAYYGNGQNTSRRCSHLSLLEQHVGSSIRVCSLSADQKQILLLRDEYMNRGSTAPGEHHLGSLTEPQHLFEELPESVTMHWQQIAENILLDAQSRQEIFKDPFVIKAFREAEKAHRGQVRV